MIKKGTIQQDVSAQMNLPLLLDNEEVADAFLDRWEDSEGTSEPDSVDTKQEVIEPESTEEELEEAEADPEEESEEATEEETEEEAEEAEEGEEEESEEDEAPKKPAKVLTDDSEVEIKVDDETHKVSVKDLKRLWGQEAALTKKSQQVAQQRKTIEDEGLKYSAGLQKLYDKAKGRWDPYSKIDFMIAAKELDSDQFANLRQEAQAAYEDFNFLTQEVDSFVTNMKTQQQETLKAQAVESVKVLKEKIPNWSNDVYDKIRTFAIDNGMDAERVNNLVDPAAIMVLNKARLYDEGKKITLKKKINTPKKVLKAGTTSLKDVSQDKKDQALNRLRSSGSTDDAADAFMSRWSND